MFSVWQNKEPSYANYLLQYYELIRAGALCNNAEFDPDQPGKILGDPTEGALIALSKTFKEEHDDLEDEYPRLYEQPFDSDRKRMSTINEINGQATVFTKGALEELLPICNTILDQGKIRPITITDQEKIQKAADDMSEKALRVLSFGKKEITEVPEEEDADVETGLTFLGLVGMIDSPREEVKMAV